MTQKPDNPQARVNYKAIAEEMANQLNMALTRLRATSDWMGTLRNRDTGECYTWEESFARSIEKIPKYQVDRRWIEAKYLPAKERRKRYAELHNETTAERILALAAQKEATHD
jgi:hypothetical protein